MNITLNSQQIKNIDIMAATGDAGLALSQWGGGGFYWDTPYYLVFNFITQKQHSNATTT